MKKKISNLFYLLTFLFISSLAAQTVVIEGTLQRWHKVTLKLTGPQASETQSNNPFLNYRFNVTFTHPATGTTYTVPGYFAADGNAANSNASSGNKWKAHLSPDHTGTWNYTISFRSGNNVAVSSSATAGSALSPFNGVSGSFNISESNKTGRDFRNKSNGRLKYVGQRYLQFAGSGKYFLKQGPDAPENLLNYADFDGQFNNSRLKTWSAHVSDWNSGDPTWDGGKGKGLIGALNYLASEGMNAFSFLSMNIGGDDNNAYPYVITNNQTGSHPDTSKTVYLNTLKTVMDCSKLDQWEVVFEHADKLGLYLHFKTQETENDHYLDGGNLGTERKLYYRELIARFSHHLALNWNLGEENTNSTSQIQDFAQFFYDNDPYRHNIVLHTYPGQKNRYDPLLGTASKLTGLSMQTSNASFGQEHGDVLEWVGKSEAANKPWVVAVDEPGDAQHAIRPDYDAGNSHEDGRKKALWGTLMAGGAGNEWYFGYGHDHSDLTCEDFRSRNQWWDYCRNALNFFSNNNIEFINMDNHNNLIGNNNNSNDAGYCFAKPGSSYVIYLPNGGSKNLNLNGVSGNFQVKWFDPRNGGGLQNGSVTSINGGGSRSIGNAPNNTGKDWVVYVSSEGTNSLPNVSFTTPVNGQNFDEPASINLVDVAATDSDGSISNVKLYLNNVFVRQENVTPYTWSASNDAALNNLAAGSYTLKAVATDNEGASSETSITINVVGDSPALAIPGRIEAEDYHNFSDTTAGNSGGAYRNDDVDIQTTNDSGGGFNVGWIASGEFLAYDVNVAQAGTYNVTFRVASQQNSNKSLHIEIDGQNVSGPVNFNTGGAGWQSFQNVSVQVDLPAGAHVLKVVMDSSSFNLNFVDFEFVDNGSNLPNGQTASDVGNTGSSTLAAFNNGTYLISASGSDIWGTSDSFGFVSQNASGDIELSAQIESIQNTNPWAKAGVMIRENLNADSKHAMTVITPGNGSSFQRRTSTGSSSSHTTFGGISAPQFVKVVRIGNNFTGYYSSDSSVWFPMNTVNIPMNANVKAGLAVTSHDNSQETEAQISNFSLANPSDKLSVLRFILVNADTNQDIREIHHNSTINLATDGSNLSIRAEASGLQESVVFNINGTNTQTESVAPYAIAGDSNGNYNAWTPSVGSHTIMATPFSEPSGAGSPGASLAVVINVVNNP